MRIFGVSNFTVGTLGANTATLGATKIDTSRLQGCKPRKIEFSLDYGGKTTAEGPIIVGLSNNLTVGEIAELFAADPQLAQDPGASEQSQRPLMILGICGRIRTAADATSAQWKSRSWPGWHVKEGESLDVFIYNADSSPLTGGTTVSLAHRILGDWLND